MRVDGRKIRKYKPKKNQVKRDKKKSELRM